MSFQPDFKPAKRKKARGKEEWVPLRDAKLGPCRACGHADVSLHHLVGGNSREDVADALVPLCGDGTRGCHGIITSTNPGASLDGTWRTWREVAALLRASLTPDEKDYVRRVKSQGFLDETYPHNDLSLPAPPLLSVSVAKCKRCGGAGREPAPASIDKPPTAKVRRNWNVAIPKNELDTGAEVLDALLDTIADGPIGVALGYDKGTPKYFLLVAALHELAA